MASSFPFRWSAKLALVLALPLLAGCGGGGGGETEATPQTVQGAGYSFEAPLGWKVTRSPSETAAASGPVDRVEVRTFRLVRRYDPSRFRAATRELDAVIARIASQLDGRVTARRTIRVDGRKVRSYVIAYDDDKSQEITFVLEGRKEHQLLCRRLESAADEPCRALLESFTLG